MSQIWLQVREESRKSLKNHAIFLQPDGTYCLNMAILEKKFP
jgi:hypothetical protein